MAQILVAEDEKDIRELIGFSLKLAGHDVRLATNGQQAIGLVKELAPDLILMDLRMPVLGGREAAAIIRQDPLSNHIPIVYLTAKDKDLMSQEDLADDSEFIAKPFSIELLNKKVAEILAR